MAGTQEYLYLDTIGTDIYITPERARLLIMELVKYLADVAEMAENASAGELDNA